MLKQFWPSAATSSSSSSTTSPATSGRSSSPSPSKSQTHLPSGPSDQRTPRATPQSNPFDHPSALAGNNPNFPGTTSYASNSVGITIGNNGSGNERSVPSSPSVGYASRPLSRSGSSFVSSGARTPTTSEYPPSISGGYGNTVPSTPPPVLGTPGASRAVTGITVGDSMSGTGGLGFGLREPPKMRRALTGGKDSAGKSNLSAGSLSLSTDSDGTEDQVQHVQGGTSGGGATTTQQHQHNPDRAPRGTLTIKLIAARNLAISSHPSSSSSSSASSTRPEPYAVIQFEQNEFVSRAPIPSSPQNAHTPFTTATTTPKPAIPRNNSFGGPSLGLSSITRAFTEAASGKRGKGASGAGGRSGTSTPRGDGQDGQVGVGGGGAGGQSQMMSELLGSQSPANPVWKEEVAFDLTSYNSIIYVSVYDRAKAAEGFLGSREIRPVVKDGMTVDNWFELQPRGQEHVTGSIWLQISYDALKTKQHLTPRDFDIMKLIGKGTFGKVFQVRKRDTKRIYAMKMLSKKDIVAKKEIAHTIGERKILQRSLECPFLVGLKFSFQTEEYLFFITDYKSGGELFWHLQKEGRFTETRARFYIAELVLALEHLHKFNIVYRDLKPENILLDATGHVALCDFGLSKPDLGNGQLTNTFCGTTEYLAPEVLLDDHGYSKLVDFWSLGVLLFEMCCGWSPFYSEDVQQMYKNICFGKIRFPRGVIGEDGKQFVKGLLNRNPKHRLGAERDAEELKEHPFFKDIDWNALAAKQVTPPFKPTVDSDESVANFDPLFTSSDLRDVPFDWGAAASVPRESEMVMPGGGGGASHSYNGPGGGIRTDRNGVPTTASSSTTGTHADGKGGDGVGNATNVAIKAARPPAKPLAGSPLTQSVQANFQGFSFAGESMLPTSVGALQLDESDEYEEDEEAVSDDEGMDGEEIGEGWRTRRQSDVDMA